MTDQETAHQAQLERELRERNAAAEQRINQLAADGIYARTPAPPAPALATEPVLRRDWDSPEEDAAWAKLEKHMTAGSLMHFLQSQRAETPLRFRANFTGEDLEIAEMYFDRKKREYIIELEFKR